MFEVSATRETEECSDDVGIWKDESKSSMTLCDGCGHGEGRWKRRIPVEKLNWEKTGGIGLQREKYHPLEMPRYFRK